MDTSKKIPEDGNTAHFSEEVQRLIRECDPTYRAGIYSRLPLGNGPDWHWIFAAETLDSFVLDYFGILLNKCDLAAEPSTIQKLADLLKSECVARTNKVLDDDAAQTWAARAHVTYARLCYFESLFVMELNPDPLRTIAKDLYLKGVRRLEDLSSGYVYAAIALAWLSTTVAQDHDKEMLENLGLTPASYQLAYDRCMVARDLATTAGIAELASILHNDMNRIKVCCWPFTK